MPPKDKKKAEKKKKDVKEAIEQIFAQDETLTEAFKEKAGILFETVLNQRIEEEVDEIKESLEEQYNENLKEAVEAHAEQLHEELDNLTTKIDEYLTYVAEEWLKENELAVEKGVRTEITESFINGMKNLFAEHYVDVPEERFDLLADAQEKVEELEKKLNEQLEANVNLSKSVKEMEKAEVLSKASDGMAETDKEKFAGCTVHYVTSKLDSGKIILQKKVKLSKKETPSSLQKKILKHEHILYPRAIRKIFVSL